MRKTGMAQRDDFWGLAVETRNSKPETVLVRPLSLIRHNPLIFIAELLWRWSFGLGATAVLFFVARRVGEALKLVGLYNIGFARSSPLERGEMLAEALVRALPLVGPVAMWAAVGVAVLWIVCATIGRGTVIRSIVRLTAADEGRRSESRFSWLAMAGAHFARVFSLIVLVIGYLLAVLAEDRILRADPAYAADPTSLPETSTLLAVVLAFSAIMGVALVLWSLVHFVASMAPIFVARDGRGTLDALADAIAFVRRRWRALLSEATQNATLRGLIAVAISVGAIAAGVLLMRTAPILAWTVIAVLTFAYCVLSDWLLLVRAVAYVQIAEEERSSIHNRATEATEKPIS